MGSSPVSRSGCGSSGVERSGEWRRWEECLLDDFLASEDVVAGSLWTCGLLCVWGGGERHRATKERK